MAKRNDREFTTVLFTVIDVRYLGYFMSKYK